MTHNIEQRRCMALKCKDSGLQDLKKLFKFPKNEELKQKWLENLGLKYSDLRSKARSLICRRHFHPKCIAIKNLHSWALPTLHLGTGKTVGIHQPIPPTNRLRKCCIQNCNSKTPAILHSLPKKPELRAKWLECCKLTTDKRKDILVCRKHFRPSFLYQAKLARNAYPELNLCIKEKDPLQESLDKVDDYYSHQQMINAEYDPLQESGFAQELGENNSEEVTVDANHTLDNCRSSNTSISSSSSSEIEEDEEETDTKTEQKDDKMRDQYLKYKNRCRKMRDENNALRDKLMQLEHKLLLPVEDQNEYIWLLLK